MGHQGRRRKDPWPQRWSARPPIYDATCRIGITRGWTDSRRAPVQEPGGCRR